MTSLRTRTAILLSAGAALAGCGSSSTGKQTPTTTTSASQTRAHFITQADAICTQARQSLSDLQSQTAKVLTLGATPKGFAVAAPLFRRVQALEQTELTRLRALPIPVGDAPTLTSYFQQGAAAVALVGQIATALAHADGKALTAAEQRGVKMAAATKGIAQGYGFKVCGHGTTGNGLT